MPRSIAAAKPDVKPFRKNISTKMLHRTDATLS